MVALFNLLQSQVYQWIADRQALASRYCTSGQVEQRRQPAALKLVGGPHNRHSLYWYTIVCIREIAVDAEDSNAG